MPGKQKAIVIETVDKQGTEWGVSIAGPNPEPKDYFKCESEERAYALKELLNIPAGHAIIRDRQGNLLIEPPIVDDEHFWCVICKEVKPLSGGFTASIELGGWTCQFHHDK